MQQSALEWHDTTLCALEPRASDVAIELDAYVHISEGIPGRDSGTGWGQAIEIVITSATVSGGVEQDARLSDGRLRVNGRDYEGLLPVPFSATGGVRLDLEAGSQSVSICGSDIRVIAVGEPVFVEKFPGA